MGFDYLAIAPPFAPGPSDDPFLTGDLDSAHPILCKSLESVAPSGRTIDVIGHLSGICKANGLGLILDVVLDRVDAKGALALSNADIFQESRSALLNPRSEGGNAAAFARFDKPELAKRLVALWAGCLGALLTVGVAGFRFLYPAGLPAWLWRLMNAILREAFPGVIVLAYTPGMSWRTIEALAGTGFDGVFSSLPWWDLHGAWFAEELNVLRRVAPVVASPTAPLGAPIKGRRTVARSAEAYRQALDVAASTGDCLLVPMECDGAFAERPSESNRDSAQAVRAAIKRLARLADFGTRGATRALTGSGDLITALAQYDAPDPRGAEKALVVLINPDLAHSRNMDIALDPVTPVSGASLGNPTLPAGSGDISAPLGAGEVRVAEVDRLAPVVSGANSPEALAHALKAPRIVIEAITPSVESGRLAARSICGEAVDVSADIFVDGHPVVAAELLWRAADEAAWQREPMRLGDNDRWQAAFVPGRVGRHYFTIEAWLNEFAGLRRDMAIKQRAGADVTVELEEAKILIKAAAADAKPQIKAALTASLNRLETTPPQDVNEILADPDIDAALEQVAARRFCVRDATSFPLEVERPQAAFAAWYELFPRSASPIAGKHGTFDDVIARLPDIRDMGFDVLYLPPIHPIGRTNRKGRNNSLTAAPDDPGSPYAIGAAEGGHDAILAQLGTFDDFRRLIAAAAAHGLEIALDFAIQCSPDHPWLKQHPSWFRRRPDGSVRYAENPPKKYEDIVNVEFYPDRAAQDVWTALRDVVLFWIDHGVRIFRVDNPHTKPLPFWEWMIGDIRARHPDVIFLAEAFTRPKMMYRLAKIGFSQSYTYFTWRNGKREIVEYMNELTRKPVVDYFRPHFFVNTPDINPYFLQQAGRPGFLVRAVLAATLSGLWGVYSGFELCEGAALPGREEYLDSEKYEIKHRDFHAPGNITAEIAILNRIRRTHRALQSQRGLTFYNAFNDQILVYGKALPSRADMILVAVNLDPHHVQEATFEAPLWEWGMKDDGSLLVEDLLRDRAPFVWTGKLQHVRLDPAEPYAIWRIAPLPGSVA